jgi:hypothetical protein
MPCHYDMRECEDCGTIRRVKVYDAVSEALKEAYSRRCTACQHRRRAEIYEDLATKHRAAAHLIFAKRAERAAKAAANKVR